MKRWGKGHANGKKLVTAEAGLQPPTCVLCHLGHWKGTTGEHLMLNTEETTRSVTPDHNMAGCQLQTSAVFPRTFHDSPMGGL